MSCHDASDPVAAVYNVLAQEEVNNSWTAFTADLALSLVNPEIFAADEGAIIAGEALVPRLLSQEPVIPERIAEGFRAADSAATETFYRTMSQANYDTLAATGKLPATSETFISPSLEYAQQYNGVTVQFNVQAGTQNALMGMGVRNSAAGFAGTAYEGLPAVQSGWASSSAFFKMEGGVVNVGLGNGSALNTFNDSIVNFSLVPKP
jgi:hypothetical protein